MSTHTPANYGGVPLNDVEMEDLSDITSALLDAIPSREPDEACEVVQVVASASTIPLGAPASNTENDTSEELHDINNTANQAPPSTVPTKTSNPTDDAAAKLRYEQLASLFANTTVELENLAPPPECTRYPEHANAILEAYLEQTTFTVNIWTNFDAAEQVFFEGARAIDCGKLQLPKKKLEWLLGLDRDRYDFHHIRLEIGTPFRTLATIFLDVHYYDDGSAFLEVIGKMVKQCPPRRLNALRDFLQTCIRKIEEVESNRSLDVDDLVGIASLFRRRRYVDEDDGEWEQPQYGGGEWAGIEEPPLLLQNSRWAF